MARRSLQPQIRILRLNAGCSPGWGPTGVATPRDFGTTFAALVTIALRKRAGILEGELEGGDGAVIVVVCGGIRIVSSGGVEEGIGFRTLELIELIEFRVRFPK